MRSSAYHPKGQGCFVLSFEMSCSYNFNNVNITYFITAGVLHAARFSLPPLVVWPEPVDAGDIPDMTAGPIWQVWDLLALALTAVVTVLLTI